MSSEFGICYISLNVDKVLFEASKKLSRILIYENCNKVLRE